MVKFNWLSKSERDLMVIDIDNVLSNYGMDKPSRNEFWKALSLGIEVQARS